MLPAKSAMEMGTLHVLIAMEMDMRLAHIARAMEENYALRAVVQDV